MWVSAIVLAAGQGLRLRSKVAKPLVKLKGRPLFIYSLATLSSHPLIKDIIVTVNSANCRDIVRTIKKYRIKKIRAVVLGGKHRQDSVYQAIKAIDKRASLILIHDAVRPFINRRQVSELIKEAKRSSAAILAVPVKDTIKEATSSYLPGRDRFKVKKTLERKKLWGVQTPQVFNRDLILKAYSRFGNTQVTDDAMLVEKLKVSVSLVMGSYDNIKITTPEDLAIAETILNKGI